MALGGSYITMLDAMLLTHEATAWSTRVEDEWLGTEIQDTKSIHDVCIGNRTPMDKIKALS